MKPFSGSVLRLGTCLGEMISDRSNSFRRRIQEQPNESLTVLTLIKVQGLTFNNFGAVGPDAGIIPELNTSKSLAVRAANAGSGIPRMATAKTGKRKNEGTRYERVKHK